MKRTFINYKPYRTEDQKAEAKKQAKMENGRWISTAPLSKHAGEKQEYIIVPIEKIDTKNLSREEILAAIKRRQGINIPTVNEGPVRKSGSIQSIIFGNKDE